MSDRSLMMVTYNRLELTKQTVQNIYDTTEDFNFCIVDNGSTDGTVEYLQELQRDNANVHLLFNPQNKGIAIGRNQALKMAVELGTDWFCTIDNDVLLPENWLDNCIDILKANKNYGAIGVNFEDVDYPLITLNGYTFQNKAQGNLGTACMVFTKSIQKTVGYFNTEYDMYGHEDACYNFRFKTMGFKIGYLADKGKHLGSNENDIGQYREFKNEKGKKNLEKFYENCRLYLSGKKSIYVPYKDS